VRSAGDLVPIEGGDAHKIVHVLRKRSGDPIEVVDSGAQRFDAILTIVDGAVQARLVERKSSGSRESPQITVAQGLPKGQKMDFVVEKLTELGLHVIVPLLSERAVASGASENKLGRWRRLAKTAAAQCGRDDIPAIASPTSFNALLESFAQYDRVLFPWELAEEVPLNTVLPKLVENARSILLVIGPEGGFSHAEADRARERGAHVLRLGSRILRTETAALVAVALLNYAV